MTAFEYLRMQEVDEVFRRYTMVVPYNVRPNAFLLTVTRQVCCECH